MKTGGGTPGHLWGTRAHVHGRHRRPGSACLRHKAAHLALCRAAHAPNGRDHGQRSCVLSGTLLPRHRLIREQTITAWGGAGQS